jgi:hypothetical protein
VRNARGYSVGQDVTKANSSGIVARKASTPAFLPDVTELHEPLLGAGSLSVRAAWWPSVPR